MTRQNPERPPGPSYYRLPEASWIMIRDEYLSGWTAKEIGAKWRVSPTSVYRHASAGGWNKDDRGRALHHQIVAESAAAAQGPDSIPWSWKAPPEGLRQGPRPLPGMWASPPRRVWSPPEGYGPMPTHLVPPHPRPPAPSEEDSDPASPAEAAEQAVAAAARALAAGRYLEAERLGRLAATMRKLAGSSSRKNARCDGDEADEDVDEEALPFDQRPLACTGATCRLEAIREEAKAKLTAFVEGPLKFDDAHDILDWADMMEGLGAPIQDEALRDLAAALKAKGPGSLHHRIDAVLERPPRSFTNPYPAAPDPEPADRSGP